MWKDLNESEHDSSNDECRYCRSDKRQRQNRTDVTEEEAFFHAVTRVENYRRQKNVEKNFRIESCFLVNLQNNNQNKTCKL